MENFNLSQTVKELCEHTEEVNRLDKQLKKFARQLLSGYTFVEDTLYPKVKAPKGFEVSCTSGNGYEFFILEDKNNNEKIYINVDCRFLNLAVCSKKGKNISFQYYGEYKISIEFGNVMRKRYDFEYKMTGEEARHIVLSSKK